MGHSVSKMVKGSFFDGSELSKQLFHEIMRSAANGMAEQLKVFLPALMQNENISRISWNYRPQQGVDQDKTSLWLLAFAAKKGQDWALHLLTKLLSHQLAITLNWNATSVEGITPFCLIESTPANKVQ